MTLLVGVVALVAFEASTSAARGDLRPTVLILGLVGCLVVWAWPLGAALALVTMAATVFLPEFKMFSVGGVRSDLPEVTAFLLIGLYLVRLVLGLDLRPPASRGLLLFAATLVCGSLVSLARGVDRQLFQGQMKAYLLYLLIVPMAAIFATARRKLLLERFVVWVSTAGCAWILVRLILGLPIVSPVDIYEFNTLGTQAGVERVRSALLELLTVATMLVFARIVTDRATPWRTLQLVLFGIIWAESYFRSAWLGLVLGAGLVLVVHRRPRSSVRLLRLALVVGAVLPVLAISAASGHLGKPAYEVFRRVQSTISPQISAESSFTDREQETKAAVAALRKHPVVGVGIAKPYGARRPFYDPVHNVIVYSERQFSHNTYLDVWLHLGLLGLVCVGSLAVFVVRTVRGGLASLGLDGGTRCLAAGAACLALAVKAVFIPMLLYRPGIIALVVAITLALPSSPEPDDSPDETAASRTPVVYR